MHVFTKVADITHGGRGELFDNFFARFSHLFFVQVVEGFDYRQMQHLLENLFQIHNGPSVENNLCRKISVHQYRSSILAHCLLWNKREVQTLPAGTSVGEIRCIPRTMENRVCCKQKTTSDFAVVLAGGCSFLHPFEHFYHCFNDSTSSLYETKVLVYKVLRTNSVGRKKSIYLHHHSDSAPTIPSKKPLMKIEFY